MAEQNERVVVSRAHRGLHESCEKTHATVYPSLFLYLKIDKYKYSGVFRFCLKATSKFDVEFILICMQAPLLNVLAPKGNKGTSFTTTFPTLIHPWNKHTKNNGWNGNKNCQKRWGPESLRMPKKLTCCQHPKIQTPPQSRIDWIDGRNIPSPE